MGEKPVRCDKKREEKRNHVGGKSEKKITGRKIKGERRKTRGYIIKK